MHSYKLLTFIGLSVLISACGSTSKSNFSIKTNSETSIISNVETLSIELLNPNNKKFDSIQLTLDTKKITASVDLSAMPLGEKLIKAKVFYDDTFEVALKKVIVVNSECSKIIHL